MTLETIALWWCYLTGGALALAITAVAWTWAIDRTLAALNLTKVIIQWHWDRLKANRSQIVTEKSQAIVNRIKDDMQ